MLCEIYVRAEPVETSPPHAPQSSSQNQVGKANCFLTVGRSLRISNMYICSVKSIYAKLATYACPFSPPHSRSFSSAIWMGGLAWSVREPAERMQSRGHIWIGIQRGNRAIKHRNYVQTRQLETTNSLTWLVVKYLRCSRLEEWGMENGHATNVSRSRQFAPKK